MNPKPRYLTKSRFKEAWECPSKLAYSGKPAYGNTKLDDTFLKALARGGFQVGKLAQLYYPGGIEIETLDSEQAIAQTTEHLRREKIILFEAAIHHRNLLARVDILVKDGSQVRLIEVKAKSFDPTDEEGFFYKKAPKGSALIPLRSGWEPYFVDVAFQTVLFQRAYPNLTVTPYLMLADKSSLTTLDGLNQEFFLTHDERGRTHAVLSHPGAAIELGAPILAEVPARKQIDTLLQSKWNDGLTFEQRIDRYAEAYASDQKLPPIPGKICRDCEYRIPSSYKARKLRSGYDECWSETYHLTPEQLEQPMVFDVGNFQGADKLITQDKLFMKDIEESDIGPEDSAAMSDPPQGMTNKQRQWEQVRMVKENDTAPTIDLRGLALNLAQHRFPLHMIDFETTTVAIPFTKGRRPYETVAFQFSHHVLHKDGRIEHRAQHLDSRRGVFPNFDFVRALKKTLDVDAGTIFRYSHHENTVLCQIKRQLENAMPGPADSLSDRDELIAWIRSITRPPKNSLKDAQAEGSWTPSREMVDLCELAKSFYLHPAMEGSWSLKSVLPAILQDSKFLQSKYAQPIYGTKNIPSLNFKNHVWISLDAKGKVMDPYSTLAPIFSKELDHQLENGDWLYEDTSAIREGGAAMTAYAQMQFTQMNDAERGRVCDALLRYCELDTLAMIFLYEYWRERVTAAE